MKSKPKTKSVSDASVEETTESLRQQIKELEKKIEDAEFRATAYKKMIEVAESMGMPVRKKVGFKR